MRLKNTIFSKIRFFLCHFDCNVLFGEYGGQLELARVHTVPNSHTGRIVNLLPNCFCYTLEITHEQLFFLLSIT